MLHISAALPPVRMLGCEVNADSDIWGKKYKKLKEKEFSFLTSLWGFVLADVVFAVVAEKGKRVTS